MPRPGVIVRSRAARGARGEPTDTGVWFVTGLTERGPADRAVHVQSLDEFERTFGGRVSYGQLYDALELYFAEGGSEAWVSRVVGGAAAVGSLNLVDRAGVPVTLRVDALGPGAWSSDLTVSVEDGAVADTFTIIVKHKGVEVERFTNLNNPEEAAAQSQHSTWVRIVDLASGSAAPTNNPAIVTNVALSAGTDDRAAVTDTEWTAALADFTKDLGPGQVSAPGRTTTAAYTALLEHAYTHNRTAYLDVADRSTRGALLTASATARTLARAEYGALFGSWLDIAGLVPNTVRAVPGSAFAAGITARLDSLEGTAGAAPAGEAGGALYASAVRTPTGGFTESDYETLNDAGVNMVQQFRNRGTQLYGFRSISANEEWRQLTAQRLRMSLTARLNSLATQFVFRTIDGQGHLFGELAGALRGECLKDFRAGVLYGDRSDPDNPDAAFSIDVGPTVNTPTTIGNGEIRAVVSARFSPFAELVLLDIVKVPVSGVV